MAMPWFSLIADGSRSCDRLPAISGEWSKPLQSGFALLPGLDPLPERPEQPKPRLQKNLGTDLTRLREFIRRSLNKSKSIQRSPTISDLRIPVLAASATIGRSHSKLDLT
jgi:hypothetical protein